MKFIKKFYMFFNVIIFSLHIFCQEFLIFPKKEKEIGPQEIEITPAGIKFSYYDPEAKKITLAGNFNNWDKDKMPLSKLEDGLWVRIVPLKEGEYEYKYIIDGEWMPGDNLKLSIKKDDKTGQLVIAKSELRPVGRYSQKIFFYGCFDVSSYYNSVSTQQLNYNNLLNLDFKLDISANMNGNVRLQTLYDNIFGFKANLYCAEYNIKFAKNKITMFYNKNLFQFNNPSLFFNNFLPLIFDSFEFAYRPDENKKFGVNHYGVLGNFLLGVTSLQTGILFNNLSYANIYFLRYDIEKLLYPLRIGLNATISSNERWIYSYYTTHDWFPDPQKPYDPSQSYWYKGFVRRNLYSIDAAFNMFSNTKLFGEYLIYNSQLVATRSNNGISGANFPSDKTWKLKENISFLYGINQVFEISDIEFIIEAGGNVSQNRYFSLLEESENTKNKNYLKMAFNSKSFQIGTDVCYTKYEYDKDFENKIKPHLLYYYEPEKFYLQEHILTAVSVSTDTAQQIFSFPKEIIGGKLFINFNFDWLYSSLKLKYELQKNNLLLDNDVKMTELISENYFKIYKQLYLSFVPRVFHYDDKLYYTNFIGTIFVLPKCGFIKLGVGVDPHSSNEDISTFVDLQRQMLYGYFLETKNIKDAEEKFRSFSNSNFVLRFLVRF